MRVRKESRGGFFGFGKTKETMGRNGVERSHRQPTELRLGGTELS